MISKKIQIVFVAVLIPFVLFYWYTYSQDVPLIDVFLPAVPVLRIDEVSTRVEIADTDAERIKGLSGRKALDTTDGLLFVFPESNYHAIWMKDMAFPIDIIWISEDLRIVDIEKNVFPDTYPKSFRPSEPAKYILETNTHYADTFGITVGQTVVLPPKLDN